MIHLIAKYLREQSGQTEFPELLTLTFEKMQSMRYGENPHQKAVFYREVGNTSGSLVNAKQLHGKELSYNNINDTNGALELLKEFDQPTVVAVKHANPCGVGSGKVYLKPMRKHIQLIRCPSSEALLLPMERLTKRLLRK
jgi:phosphoribosylaminoimidazolecarboxamide formyltransferase/IMP cyclohydrolase